MYIHLSLIHIFLEGCSRQEAVCCKGGLCNTQEHLRAGGFFQVLLADVYKRQLQENASLQAQQIADTLLEEMSGKSFADNADELTRYDPDLLNGAVYVLSLIHI